MKKYRIKLNNKIYEVEMEEVTGSTSEITKRSGPVQSNDLAQSIDGTIVEAPMAGSILGISVKVGDQVKKDQVLIILEAMKMENEISSPMDGKIISIGISKGDSVNAGCVLVQIK